MRPSARFFDDSSPPDASFPETESGLLAEAAGGSWARFFEDYLQPCWREVLLTCRTRNLPLSDAQDLLQELSIRLLRDGGDAAKEGIVTRYLEARKTAQNGGRFRSFLKGVIANLFREHFRRTAKLPEALSPDRDRAIDESVSDGLDRQWVFGLLATAVARFRERCGAARTKGDRRGYELLFLTLVEGRTLIEVSAQLDLDPSTVGSQLSTARAQFLKDLADVTGIEDMGFLKRILTSDPERLIEAVRAAQHGSTGTLEKTAPDVR